MNTLKTCGNLWQRSLRGQSSRPLTNNLGYQWHSDCLSPGRFLRPPCCPALLLCCGDSPFSSRRHCPLLGLVDLYATVISGFGRSCLLRRCDPGTLRRRDASSAVLFSICRTKGFEGRGDSFDLLRQPIMFSSQKLNCTADIRHFEDFLLARRL